LKSLGKLAISVQQVGVAVEHLVVAGGRDLAARRDAVAFGCQSCDLHIEPVKSRLPVGIRVGGNAADDIENGVGYVTH